MKYWKSFEEHDNEQDPKVKLIMAYVAVGSIAFALLCLITAYLYFKTEEI